MKQSMSYSVRLFARLCAFLPLLFVLSSQENIAQNIAKNKYGLPVVSDYHIYEQLCKKDSNFSLVDLEKYLPGIVLDIRYATTNNVTRSKLYDAPHAFTSLSVARALKKARAELRELGYDFKIFDAYRPYSATLKLWNAVQDDRYAGTPEKGSRHNRGCAVDITLISLKTGKEIAMPTNFDTFSDKAHANYKNLPPAVLKNRKLLREEMEKVGFKELSSEWWHFDFNGWKNYPLLDIPFEKLMQ